jgi:DNA-binding winged helix-turn-helix (wHTH) protein
VDGQAPADPRCGRSDARIRPISGAAARAGVARHSGPIELGTRAFDLLLVLLAADGSLVTKGELLKRVWPSIMVTEHDLKVQVWALRRALGEDRDFIRTEFGLGYRFTAAISSTVAPGAGQCKMRHRGRSDRQLFPSGTCR